MKCDIRENGVSTDQRLFPRLFLRYTGPEYSWVSVEERASFEVDGSSVVYFMNGEFPSSSMREERGTIDREIRAADAVRTTHDPITGPVLLYVTLASAKNCVFSRRMGALRPAIGVITPRPVFTKNLPSLCATLAFPPHQHHLRNSLKNTEYYLPSFSLSCSSGQISPPLLLPSQIFLSFFTSLHVKFSNHRSSCYPLSFRFEILRSLSSMYKNLNICALIVIIPSIT